jgi:hypothetical protein
MIVEEFWKKNQAWNPKDDFDKQTVRFNYWDMLDFAEQYASKQLELIGVVQAKPEKHFCEIKESGRGKRCKKQCEECNWFEFRNKQK